MGCGSIEELSEIRLKYASTLEQLRKMRKSFKRKPKYKNFLDQLAPGRVFISSRGTPYVCLAWPDQEYRNVDAARLAVPLRFRRGKINSHRVAFHRIRDLSIVLDPCPEPEDREGWEDLKTRAEAGEFAPIEVEGAVSNPADLASREFESMAERLGSFPCEKCTLFGPCQKDTAHPFSSALRRYFHYFAKVDSTQAQLWRSFLKHIQLLQAEGYVNEEGKVTPDGMWASKLRLDQPLLISEGIRNDVFPRNQPELLAALIAPFVMDRDRQGDVQLATLIWKYPDLAKPFFQMLQNLQRLRERLQAEGFEVPPLPFWAVITVYHWAKGLSWGEVREITGMDEGDLASIILRTADHLRQIEALSDTHPRLAATAAEGIRMLLREPVLPP